MSADDLQRWASVVRWVGLSVTAIGVLITFGSHYIADKLLVLQRAEKAVAQERLKVSAAELQATKQKTAELADRAAFRSISQAQRTAFLAAAADQPKGALTVISLAGQAEATQYAHALADLISAAGYEVTMGSMMPMGSVTGAGLTVKLSESYPPHTDGLLAAFEAAGIPMGKAHNGLQAADILGLVVGSKP